MSTDDSSAGAGVGAAVAESPESANAVPLLRLRGVSKSFGAVHALVDIDLTFPGVTALAGDNGAGNRAHQ